MVFQIDIIMISITKIQLLEITRESLLNQVSEIRNLAHMSRIKQIYIYIIFLIKLLSNNL